MVNWLPQFCCCSRAARDGRERMVEQAVHLMVSGKQRERRSPASHGPCQGHAPSALNSPTRSHFCDVLFCFVLAPFLEGTTSQWH